MNSIEERQIPCLQSALSKKELEICDLIAKGFSGGQIAKLLFLSEGTVKNYTSQIYDKAGVINRAQLAAKYIAEYARASTELPDTDVGSKENGIEKPAAWFRLVGDRGLPGSIPLAFTGQSFTIGRYDISIGRKQSDFEFSHTTKAVSRRHASITHASTRYALEDMNSRAGTFVNGKRIAPGSLHLLADGDKVSFGTAGADYIFEIEIMHAEQADA